MKSSFAAGLLLATSANALLELPVVKRDRHNNGKTADVARGLVKRAAGTLETTLFSGVGYVSGGAYYANSEPCFALSHNMRELTKIL